MTTREWLSFDDTDGDRWLFDLTFLTSNWTCVFGSTCQGINEDPVLGRLQGCCSHGVHLVDEEDADIVSAAAARLRVDEWENHGLVVTADDLFARSDEGELMTAVHDGACIFLNGPDAPTGPGCALHFGADRVGEGYPQWKPAACWQLPLRLEEMTDTNGTTTSMVRSWGRADWGPGGAEFSWWCTEDDDAFVGDDLVYRTLRDELVELVGEEAYEWLAGQLDKRLGHGALTETSVSLSDSGA